MRSVNTARNRFNVAGWETMVVGIFEECHPDYGTICEEGLHC